MSIQIRSIRAGVVLGLVGVVALCASSCSSKSRSVEAARPHPMGTPVYVGPLTFTALEAEWKDELDGETGQRQPKHRFLLVRVTVTNGGGAEQGLPLLSLVDSKGNTYLEEDKGEGVARWLGLLRMLKPAQTEEGYLLFDAPPGSYQLRVTTGGDPEQEMSATIEIPFKLDTSGGVPDIVLPEKK